MELIRLYWVQIVFIVSLLITLLKFAKAMVEATKCSLRNDILSVYDRCKDKKQISQWQLESIEKSYEQYKALKGNSFVDNLYKRVQTFEVID